VTTPILPPPDASLVVPPAPRPPMLPPPLPAAYAPPTTAQVVSAALQNVAVAAVVGWAWYADKVDSTVAIPVLLAIVGVDWVGRKRVGAGHVGAALAFGSTGILTAAGGLGSVGTGLLILVLSLVGCGGMDTLMPTLGHSLHQQAAAWRALCLDVPDTDADRWAKCEVSRISLESAIRAYNRANESIPEGVR